jgi:hypothetical protein
MLTIAPPPEASMIGRTCWIATMTAPRLSSSVRRQCEGGASGNTGGS